MSNHKMKKFYILCACLALAGFVSCQKQQTEEERKAEIDRQVEQRLAAERQAQQQQELTQREAELNAREKALAGKQNTAATQTPRPRAPSIARATRESSEEGGSYNIFYTKLERYGDWRETSDYGYVWQPREAERSRSWHPYTNGRWVYTDAGWTWISEEPFGWATYHYGRWARLRNVGWVWVPGDEWAPAWVSWRKGDEYVGWAPLPPEARFDRRRGIHNWADNYYDIGPDQYRFVPTREFGTQQIERTVVPRERNVTIINQTTNVTNITYNNTTVVNQGPNYGELRTRSQQPIERLRLEREVNVDLNVEVGRPVVRGEVLAIPAPVIAIGRPAERPRTAKAAIAQTIIEHGWEDIGDRQAAEQARTKMKSESTPPADAPSKTFVKPEMAAAQPTAAAASAAPTESASPSPLATTTATSTPPVRAQRPETPAASATPSPTKLPSATPTSTPDRARSTETPSASATSPIETPSVSPTFAPEQSAPAKVMETAPPSASPAATPTPTVTPAATSSPSPMESLPPPAIIRTPPRKITPLPTSTASPSVSPSGALESPQQKVEKPGRLLQRFKVQPEETKPRQVIPLSPSVSPSATSTAGATTSPVSTPRLAPTARSTTTPSSTPEGSSTPGSAADVSPSPTSKHEGKGKLKREREKPVQPGETVSPTTAPTPTPTPATEERRLRSAGKIDVGTCTPLGELLRVRERVDGIDIFVPPDGFDARKTQRQAAGVSRARLNRIESHFEHDVRFHFAIAATIDNRVLFEMLG